MNDPDFRLVVDADHWAPAKPLRRTRRWSWMVSGWFEPKELSADEGGTACMTLGCSDDFVAVRLGFPNLSRAPWRITRAIARPSTSFNDYVTPTGDAPWTAFTMVNGGADASAIVTGNDAPSEIEVLGIDDSPLARASGIGWTWTDWAPIHSLAADPTTGMRVLMLRALVPAGQTVTTAIGQLRGFTGNSTLNGNHDVFIGGLKFNIDMVSDPDRPEPVTTQTWLDNQLAHGPMFPMVQFLTKRRGISGIATGDSHLQGTSTLEQFSSCVYRATTALGQEYLNGIPFSMTNCACGGLGSEEFFARFQSLLHAVEPSFAVLPGWTFNDKTGDTWADMTAMNAFLSRLMNACELCETNNVTPIILTPFPRDPGVMTEVQLAPWRWLREVLLGLDDPDIVIIDATAILGHQPNGVFDGTYNPALSTDQMHHNDEGHAAVARVLADVIKRRL